MHRWNNRGVAQRLWLAFGLVIALGVGVGALTLGRLAALETRLEELGTESLPRIIVLRDAAEQADMIARDVRTLLLSDDGAVARDVQARIAASREAIGLVLDFLQANLKADAAREVLGALKAAEREWSGSLDRFLALRAAGKVAEARALLFGDMARHHESVAMLARALGEYEQKAAETAVAEASASYLLSRNVTLVLLVLMATLGAGFAAVTARSVKRPIDQAVELARAVAGGDLSQRVEATTRDEFGALMQALDDMVVQLSRIVGGVRTGTDQIGSASAQIATGNQDLSSRTEQQAASLQQTAASMEQLSASVASNAAAAHAASTRAASASAVAQRGGHLVGAVVETMEQIQASSRRVADIIGVIDGIAFQTNILALNAAVEAARAGEQGRGFAVVAGEVRNLAQRSAQAAREIKGLIDESVTRVDGGSAQVHAAGATMQSIVDEVRQVTELIGQITGATDQQASGIRQVNDAVTQLDRATQQNASLVEQSATAAAAMRQQAEALTQAVRVFRLAAATPA